MSEQRYLGWHWLPQNKKTRFDDREVVPGVPMTVRGQPALGLHGLHATRTFAESICNAVGPVCCRVLLEGEIDRDHFRIAASTRTCLWMVDTRNLILQWYCQRAVEVAAYLEHPGLFKWANKVEHTFLKGNLEGNRKSLFDEYITTVPGGNHYPLVAGVLRDLAHLLGGYCIPYLRNIPSLAPKLDTLLNRPEGFCLNHFYRLVMVMAKDTTGVWVPDPNPVEPGIFKRVFDPWVRSV